MLATCGQTVVNYSYIEKELIWKEICLGQNRFDGVIEITWQQFLMLILVNRWQFAETATSQLWLEQLQRWWSFPDYWKLWYHTVGGQKWKLIPLVAVLSLMTLKRFVQGRTCTAGNTGQCKANIFSPTLFKEKLSETFFHLQYILSKNFLKPYITDAIVV